MFLSLKKVRLWVSLAVGLPGYLLGTEPAVRDEDRMMRLSILRIFLPRVYFF